MATFVIKYIDGDSETLTADKVEEEGTQYTGYIDDEIIAHIPMVNVRSIVLQPEARTELRIGDRTLHGVVSDHRGQTICGECSALDR